MISHENQGAEMAHQHGIAGKSVRALQFKRNQKFSILAGALLLAGLFLLFNAHRVAKLGLPAVIILVVAVNCWGDHIEKRALHFKKRAKDADRGALAEEKVAIQLNDLPEGYHAFHDIVFNGFNIDHVVIGPGGIFLIETKSHRGKVDANGDALLLNGKPPIKDFLKQTWSQTYHLKDFLWKMTSQEWKVQPVLCFSNAFVKVRKPVKGIEVIRIGYLKKYLSTRRTSLTTEQIERLQRPPSYWIAKQS